MSELVLKERDALLIVDVQNDFLPGGSLAVPEGDAVIEPLNRCIAAFGRNRLPVYASRDWHPLDHCSFAAQGGPWPPHCVAGSHGAEFAAALALPPDAVIISKADTPQRDAYSAFGGTDLHQRLQADGVKRLFVGGLARRVRRILDDGGLHATTIFASGDLDEYRIRDLLAQGAPIDGFGVGTRLDTSADAPFLDCAYKLQEYAGRPRRKRSLGKATRPGRKQVWRSFDTAGRMVNDMIGLADEQQPGMPLLQPVMRGGRRLQQPGLEESRHHAAHNLGQLPAALAALQDEAYAVAVSLALQQLAAAVDADMTPPESVMAEEML